MAQIHVEQGDLTACAVDAIVNAANNDLVLGGRTTEEGLRNSTRAVLALAEAKEIKTLAFPATGTGIAGFPLERCAEIMLTEVHNHIARGTKLTDVYFILWDEPACRIFQEAAERLSV